jgi:hypothetical protein
MSLADHARLLTKALRDIERISEPSSAATFLAREALQAVGEKLEPWRPLPLFGPGCTFVSD